MKITRENIKRIYFTKKFISLETNEGVTQSMPLSWFKTLANATEEQRNNFFMSYEGVHWEELDEDLSFEGFFTYKGQISEAI